MRNIARAPVWLSLIALLAGCGASNGPDSSRPDSTRPPIGENRDGEDVGMVLSPETQVVDWLRKVSPRHADLEVRDWQDVASVRIDGDYEPDELLMLQYLPSLRAVVIWRDGESFGKPAPKPAPTDDDLERLAQIETLQSVTIGGWSAPFTDDGLEALAASESIERLKLTQAMNVTDDGMRHVAAMPQLASLDITMTKVTDVGLAHLLESESLEDVEFGWAAEATRALERFKAAHPDRRFLRDE